MRAIATAFHLRIDANGLFAGFRDVAAPKSGECPRGGARRPRRAAERAPYRKIISVARALRGGAGTSTPTTVANDAPVASRTVTSA